MVRIWMFLIVSGPAARVFQYIIIVRIYSRYIGNADFMTGPVLECIKYSLPHPQSDSNIPLLMNIDEYE